MKHQKGEIIGITIKEEKREEEGESRYEKEEKEERYRNSWGERKDGKITEGAARRNRDVRRR